LADIQKKRQAKWLTRIDDLFPIKESDTFNEPLGLHGTIFERKEGPGFPGPSTDMVFE
jgi:hypothetical protein